jgi:ABC-type multidrug transport system ATPase subunit
MKVSLTDAGKRFNRDWIFRHLTYTFQENSCYAIVGPNGSGKSTLLQVLSGAMQASEGKCEWTSDNGLLANENVYSNVAICAPYLELVEEMTLKEFLEFHIHFKPWLPTVDSASIVAIVGLQQALNKQIRYYSSGMKQRVKLAQAFFSDTPVLFLDEPCTSLDTSGVDLYHRLISQYSRNRLVIVSSNDEVEYSFCTERINVVDYKQ